MFYVSYFHAIWCEIEAFPVAQMNRVTSNLEKPYLSLGWWRRKEETPGTSWMAKTSVSAANVHFNQSTYFGAMTSNSFNLSRRNLGRPSFSFLMAGNSEKVSRELALPVAYLNHNITVILHCAFVKAPFLKAQLK